MLVRSVGLSQPRELSSFSVDASALVDSPVETWIPAAACSRKASLAVIAGARPEKVTGFIARAIGERQNLLRRGFGKRVRLDDPAIRQVRKLLAGPEHRARLKREDQLLANRDIYFDAAAGGQWSNVSQIERVTVRVRVTILAVEPEFDAAAVSNGGVNRLQSLADSLNGHRRKQCKGRARSTRAYRRATRAVPT